jgi:VanZ family protein
MPSSQTMQSNMRGFLLHHLPATAMAAAILFISSIPNLAGPGNSIFGFDKVMHIAEYSLFSWLVLRSLSRFKPDGMTTTVLFVIVLVVAIFAGLDEYLQSFVPGRDSTVADFAADLIGAGGAAYVWKRWSGGRN